jgi:hypothetical protein
MRLVIEKSMKPNLFSLRNYLLNEEINERSNCYPFLFDHKLCSSLAKIEAVRELCDAIAATKEFLIAKKRNPANLQMKMRTKEDPTNNSVSH